MEKLVLIHRLSSSTSNDLRRASCIPAFPHGAHVELINHHRLKFSVLKALRETDARNLFSEIDRSKQAHLPLSDSFITRIFNTYSTWYSWILSTRNSRNTVAAISGLKDARQACCGFLLDEIVLIDDEWSNVTKATLSALARKSW